MSRMTVDDVNRVILQITKTMVIENDFCSSTIWAIQIQDSFAEFKNPKIPGIQPSDCGRVI